MPGFARRRRTLVLAYAVCAASTARATDFVGVLPAALDQPRINAYVARGPAGAPLTYDFGGGFEAFNITAFFDTGASGVLLSNNTADLLGVERSTFNGEDVVFGDVGVAGTALFNVSEQLRVGLAKYHPDADVDNLDTYSSVYTTQFNNVRTQIGPVGVDPDPAIGDLDVFGMPLFQGKTMVMDARPTNTFLDTMRTYVYPTGTPYNPALDASEPGVPVPERTVRLSYGDFDGFTTVTPNGAPGPTLNENPFIGPDPINPAGDTTPPVTIGYGTQSTNASFLLDTGAAASIISTGKAQQLGVTYDPATVNTDDPVLLGVPEDEQFQLTIGGIGGSKKVAGFFLDSMLLKTEQGNAANPNDPNHLRFLGAPVLVFDITLADPTTGDPFTLDGIFGMNYLVSTAFIEDGGAGGTPTIGALARGNFDFVTFDQPTGKLGFTLRDPSAQNDLQWFGDIFGGPEGRNWAIGANPNWLDDSGFAVYEDGDRVVFGETAIEYNVRIMEPVAPGGVAITVAEDDQYRFYGPGRITGLTGVRKFGAGEWRVETANTYTGATEVNGGFVTFAAAQDVGALVVAAGAEVSVGVASRFKGALDVAGTVRSRAAGRGALRAERVVASGAGRVDLGDDVLILDQQTPGELRPELASAYAGGAWSGPGLMTDLLPGLGAQLALGYARADAVGITTSWLGFAVEPDDVLVRITLRGDFDLDGSVDFADLAALAATYGAASGATWQTGDANYDGATGFADLAAIASNYGGTYARPGAVTFDPALAAQFGTHWAWALAGVPEPTALMLAPLAGLRRVRFSGRRPAQTVR